VDRSAYTALNAGPAMKRVILECIFPHIVGDAVVYHRHLTDISRIEGSPTLIAQSLYRVMFDTTGDLPADLVVHSTSWRFDPEEDALVLTYLVHSDEMDLSAFELDRVPVEDFARSPAQSNAYDDVSLHVRDVVKHAVRHLAFLVDHDPTLEAIFAGKPEMRVLRALDPAVAGNLTPIEQTELEPGID
jgi:hypothetical protein